MALALGRLRRSLLGGIKERELKQVNQTACINSGNNHNIPRSQPAFGWMAETCFGRRGNGVRVGQIPPRACICSARQSQSRGWRIAASSAALPPYPAPARTMGASRSQPLRTSCSSRPYPWPACVDRRTAHRLPWCQTRVPC